MNSIKWNTDPWDGVLVESNTNFSFLNFDFFSKLTVELNFSVLEFEQWNIDYFENCFI